MLELGDTSPEEHQKIADRLAAMNLSIVLLAGKMFSKCRVPSNFLLFEESSSLADYLELKRLQGYLFLIKGSRG